MNNNICVLDSKNGYQAPYDKCVLDLYSITNDPSDEPPFALTAKNMEYLCMKADIHNDCRVAELADNLNDYFSSLEKHDDKAIARFLQGYNNGNLMMQEQEYEVFMRIFEKTGGYLTAVNYLDAIEQRRAERAENGLAILDLKGLNGIDCILIANALVTATEKDENTNVCNVKISLKGNGKCSVTYDKDGETITDSTSIVDETTTVREFDLSGFNGVSLVEMTSIIAQGIGSGIVDFDFNDDLEFVLYEDGLRLHNNTTQTVVLTENGDAERVYNIFNNESEVVVEGTYPYLKECLYSPLYTASCSDLTIPTCSTAFKQLQEIAAAHHDDNAAFLCKKMADYLKLAESGANKKERVNNEREARAEIVDKNLGEEREIFAEIVKYAETYAHFKGTPCLERD